MKWSKLTFLSKSLIVLFFAVNIPATTKINGVTDEQFNAIFGQSMWIIVGSITAFLVSSKYKSSIKWVSGRLIFPTL